MKIQTIAVAAILSLTSSLAIAQTSLDSRTAVPQRPAAVAPSDGAPSADPAGTLEADKTVGEAPSRPATPGVVPGARDKSRVGGEGVSDKPAGN